MAGDRDVSPREERIDGASGLKLFVRSWRPASSPKAVVVICHGVNSHSGQYAWPAGQLAGAGFAVYAIDLRGRGKSDGPRFYIDDVSEYVNDVAAVIKLAKSREPGQPVFLLGHSAGGLTSCMYALDHQATLAGLICESYAYRVPAPAFALSLIKGLSRIAPHLPVLKLKNRDFSRDPNAVRALDADALTAGEVQPAATVAALVRAGERLTREFARITLPVLILHGTADKATVPAGSQFFYDHAGSKDKTITFYEGHFHDLLNDRGKETVMADVTAWLDKHLARV